MKTSEELRSFELIAVDEAAKLTFAPDIGIDGRVYYWNGNNNFADWTTVGVPQNIFLNLLDAEILRPSLCFEPIE